LIGGGKKAWGFEKHHTKWRTTINDSLQATTNLKRNLFQSPMA
jgi:hypothetical protein